MEGLRKTWKRLPVHIRKAIVLVVGMAFVIISPFTGVLPGPGGIPIFLIGVAILATEFHWAERLRDYFLGLLHRLIARYRKDKTIGNVVIALCIAAFGTMFYVIYTRVI